LVNGLTEEQIDIGTSIRPPCRFQELSIDGPAQTKVILDVAHNPDAMVYLVRKLKTTYPDSSFRFVTGMSSDKDLSKCGTTLLSINGNDPTKIHLVEGESPCF
jgi:dihydrofolate synthase/folylpolyglutamate synthase